MRLRSGTRLVFASSGGIAYGAAEIVSINADYRTPFIWGSSSLPTKS